MKKQIYKDVFRYIWLPICISVSHYCLEGLTSVRLAGLFGHFADAVFALDFSQGIQNVYSFLAVLLIIILLIPALSFLEDVVLVKNAFAHDRRVLGRFLDKSCEAVGKIEAGDMLDRLDNDPNELRLELVTILSAALMIPATLAYLLVSVHRTSRIYFLIVAAISLVKFFVPVLIKKAEKKYHKEEKEYASAVRSYETDMSDRAHLINLFGMREPFLSRFERLYQAYFKNTKKKSIRLEAAVKSVQSLIDTLCIMMILFVGAYMVAIRQISPGAVAAMMGYYSVLNTIIGKLDYIIRRVPILDNLAERLRYFYEDCEQVEGKPLEQFEVLRGEKLTFVREDQSILDSVSFTVRCGDKAVICGENGSGKSTLMKLALGLLEGYQGTLEVNGTALSDIDKNSYRSLVSYAPQDPYLFKGTVLENVKLAKKEADEAEIRHLMQEYGIGHLAQREIQGGRYELSGGERQKLSLIRAMIRDTPIVFIDEPENNLDAAAMEKLERWMRTSCKTIVYVSHSAELIACANQRIGISHK